MDGLKVAYTISIYITLSSIKLLGSRLFARGTGRCSLSWHPGKGNGIGEHLAGLNHISK
jgi:hypothetical protein